MACSRTTCLHQRMLCSTSPSAEYQPRCASVAVAAAIRDSARVHPKPSLLSPSLVSYKATRSTRSCRRDPHLSCLVQLYLDTASRMLFRVASTSVSRSHLPRYQSVSSILSLCCFSSCRRRSMIERPEAMRRLKPWWQWRLFWRR